MFKIVFIFEVVFARNLKIPILCSFFLSWGKKLSEIILVCKDSDFELESKQQFKDGLWAQANG